ncbi:MAG: type III-A CRISPR-associated protein Csm2 [Thermodesulfobacteriaceae bacterium]|jgi:CRISPR type III-A-associated protein Csm2
MIKERENVQSYVKNLPNVKNATIKKFIEEINEKKGLKQFDLGELIKPNKYAHKISTSLKLTRVQLRKIFTEFKTAYEMYKKGKDQYQIKARLYRLYPILQYQVNRNVIDNDFKELMWVILDSLDKDLENFDNTIEFMEALVAYLKE